MLCYVSIHAPAGGATVSNSPSLESTTVSIHAPAGGATFVELNPNAAIYGFNPRTRGGCDLHPMSRW